MLVTTTVDVKHLIDRGALVVNPTFIPKTKEELINYLSDRADKSDWNHIFIPYTIANYAFDLTDFTSFTSFNLKEDFGCVKGTTLDTLRLHFLSEYIDSMFVIDMYYTLTKSELYRLTKVTVYDECHRDDNYKFTFKLGEGIHNSAMSPGHVRSLKFDLNRFELISEVVYEAE